jgi:Mannosylglycerate hydrolase MGH1-like glycoside hydrolase domain
MENYPRAYEAADNCLANELAEAERRFRGNKNEELSDHMPGYTPPERNGHYRWLHRWDQTFASIMTARAGQRKYLQSGATGLRTLVSVQLENGLIPCRDTMGINRPFELETLDKESMFGQPHLEAWAALELEDSLSRQEDVTPIESLKEARALLEDVYFPIGKDIRYFDENRTDGPLSKLISNTRAEETGRDSGREFDGFKTLRLPPIGFSPNRPFHAVAKANTVINYGYRLYQDRQVKNARGDMDKLRQIFWHKDIEMNVLFAVQCMSMAKIAEKLGRPDAEIEYFEDLGKQVEYQILKPWDPLDKAVPGMWFPDREDEIGHGSFHALDKDLQPILTESCANMSVFLLPNIREDQLKAVLSQARRKFMLPYGMPSIATDDPSYDPGYREIESIWHGPGWMNQDFLAVEGLLLQINRPDISDHTKAECKELLWHYLSATNNLLDMWAEEGKPVPEFHNPETGKGYRLWRVKHFTWNYLPRVMPVTLKPAVITNTLLGFNEAEQTSRRLAEIMSDQGFLT